MTQHVSVYIDATKDGADIAIASGVIFFAKTPEVGFIIGSFHDVGPRQLYLDPQPLDLNLVVPNYRV
jgi:hypothetical protein